MCTGDTQAKMNLWYQPCLSACLTLAKLSGFPGSQFSTSIRWEQRDWLHLLAGILERIKLHRVKKEFSRMETYMYKSATTSEGLMIWVPKRAEEGAPCQHGIR